MKVALLDDQAALASALTAKDPVNRAIGRCVTSGWPSGVEAWLQAEIDRGTEPADVLTALIHSQATILASLAGFFGDGRRDEVLLGAVKRHLDQHFVNMTAEYRAAQRVAQR